MNKILFLLAFSTIYVFSGCLQLTPPGSSTIKNPGTSKESTPENKPETGDKVPQTEPKSEPEKESGSQTAKPETKPQPEKAPELKPNFAGSYQDLAKEFDRIIGLFSPQYATLAVTEQQKQELISFAKREDYQTSLPMGYFCNCAKVEKIRGQGMAALVENVEKVAQKDAATVFFLFLGTGAAFTEFLALDALLDRSPKIKVAMDFVDPIYDLAKEDQDISDETKAMVNILMASLAQKYPGRILGYKMRADNFSKLPKDERSLPFLLLPDASAKNSDSSIQDQNFSAPGKKILVLAAFDLELQSGLSSHTKSKEIFAALATALASEGLKYSYDGNYSLDQSFSSQLQKLYKKPANAIQKQFKFSAKILENIFKDQNSWQLMSILVAEHKISVDNPLKENY